MSKHTPGPWRKGLAMDGIFVEGQGHRVVCRMISHDREDDLSLILAAPDLLAWLQFAVKILGEMPGIGNTWQVDQMRAAIAKATGDQE
jgi:hypothetical protein